MFLSNLSHPKGLTKWCHFALPMNAYKINMHHKAGLQINNEILQAEERLKFQWNRESSLNSLKLSEERTINSWSQRKCLAFHNPSMSRRIIQCQATNISQDWSEFVARILTQLLPNAQKKEWSLNGLEATHFLAKFQIEQTEDYNYD